jgi:hypothetical protein
VDESERTVGLLAKIGFPREIAQAHAERSERPAIHLAGVYWQADVRLQSALAGRSVVDRGLEASDAVPGETVRDQALGRLDAELSEAKTPSERRRIRQQIRAIRRNPLKATPPDR